MYRITRGSRVPVTQRVTLGRRSYRVCYGLVAAFIVPYKIKSACGGVCDALDQDIPLRKQAYAGQVSFRLDPNIAWRVVDRMTDIITLSGRHLFPLKMASILRLALP